MKTRRSAIVQFQRCPRSRWWLYEYQGVGLEPIRQSIPLATGTAVHMGFALLLKGESIQTAVSTTLSEYDKVCESRGLDVSDLEAYSFVYREQRALIEALIRLSALRVVPKLLETYEILEVERHGEVLLTAAVDFGYRPDALMRHREDGDLYILSLKTVGQYTKLTEESFRVDMQGISEVWAREQDGLGEKVRGVQMVYLVKGKKVQQEDQPKDDIKRTRIDCPLIWGYKDQSFPPKMALRRKWQCSEPHPMRRSKWYPNGECPGDGRNHLLGEAWDAFPVWETLGVEEWMRLLDSGELGQGALDQNWVIPVPKFRNQEHIDHWLTQVKYQESKVAESVNLDEQFPQFTHTCNQYFGGKCPCYEICWGTAQEPLESGLYQLRQPETLEAGEEEE